MSSESTLLKVPDQWPAEVASLYQPVKVLGTGGFASVLLARQRAEASEGSLAAIKIVGGGNCSSNSNAAVQQRQVVGYAHREFEILSELAHPNIVKLLNHWENRNTTGVVIMALSYAQGPSLHHLIQKRGRLSFVFSRVVSAQLIDAIAYLHSRAVLHRDIKPDNLIVTGASYSQEEIWNDSVVQPPQQQQQDPICWSNLVTKWHVTLVDFGFARALSPSDMKEAACNTSLSRPLDASGGSSTSRSSSSRRRLDRSISRRFSRMMSAVGNRAYAAPEVQRNVQQQDLDLSASGRAGTASRLRSSKLTVDVTKTLSNHVSYYGLNADAFSVGSTMIHMLTGVRPDQDVNEVVALENSPIVVLCRWLCNSLGANKAGADHSSSGVVKYRRMGDIEPEAKRLIKGLTHPDPSQRTTVRTARLYPYVDDVLAGRDQNQSFKTMEYLQCVLQKEQEKKTTTVSTTSSASEQQDVAISLTTKPDEDATTETTKT